MISQTYLAGIICSMLVASPGCMWGAQDTARMDSSPADQRTLQDMGSSDHNVATQAVQKAFDDGEASIAWLVGCQGDHRPYPGKPFGRKLSSTLMLYPENAASELWPISVEVACLYVLQAIFDDDMEHASSMLLTDHTLPVMDRRAKNTPKLVERAWREVVTWYSEYKKEGLKSTRIRSRSPLSDVGFW